MVAEAHRTRNKSCERAGWDVGGGRLGISTLGVEIVRGMVVVVVVVAVLLMVGLEVILERSV